MTQALRHRGPDAGGILDRSPLAVLGHRRLAIIDLESGDQPMGTSDGLLWVTFNGEIYNFPELRDQLQAKGHAFRTRSDTEVILAAYREWGEACPERFEGMFAFALLDVPARRLFLARDHVGKKPLYIRWRDSVLDFASEVGALRHAEDWRGDFDPLAWAFYLRLGYIPSPWSVYRGVEKIRPGECCTVSREGIRKRRYWNPAEAGFELEDMSTEALVEHIDREVIGAVGRRLMSEVPLGAFLSGGIDSGIVVGAMAALRGPGVETITVGFQDEPSELEAARQVAEKHATHHQEFVVAPQLSEIARVLPDYFGEPFADSSAIPTWHVSEQARRRVTVVLTGDGGDEPFGGYDSRYFPHLRDARLRKHVPHFAQRTLLSWLARAWPSRHNLPRLLRLGTVFRNLALDEDGAFYRDLCITQSEVAARLAPDIAGCGADVEEHVRSVYNAGRGSDPLSSIMRADVGFYMTEDVLVKVDRMSMAHALEVRSPLLSRQVVELALSIPGRIKMADGVSKRLLREVSTRYLPPTVRSLPKRGFHIPIDRWFRHELRSVFEEQVLDDDRSDLGWLDRDAVKNLWTQELAGSYQHGGALWSVWSLKLWLESLREDREVQTSTEELTRVG